MEYSPDKRKPKKLQKNKSFISRLSSVLVRNQLRLNNDQQCEDTSSFVKSETATTDPEKMKKSLKAFDYDDTIDCTTEYATICDIIQADRSDDDESPPVPPKNLNELYAKVNKKKVSVNDSCNPDLPASLSPPINKVDEKVSRHLAVEAKVNEVDGKVNGHLAIEAKMNEKIPSALKIASATQVKEPRKRHVNKSKTERKTKSSNILNAVLLQHQEELQSLKEEMEKVMSRNEDLQIHIKSLLEQEKKWKEDMSTTILSQRDHMNIMGKNAELNEKITRLELETKQEVQLLCDRVLVIQMERDKFREEVQTLKKENELNLRRYNQLKEERRGFISVETHLNEIKKNQSYQKEIVAKHEKELKMIQEKCDKYETEKNTYRMDNELLKDSKKQLENEVTNLKIQNTELKETNEQQSKQLGEVARKERENYELVFSMTSTINKLTSERDLLLRKSSFFETKQKELLAAYAQQTQGFIHLQDHIVNDKKQMDNDFHEATIKVKEAEANYTRMKVSYEQQLEALKNKVLEQTYAIESLTEDKKKLQQDFTNMWTTVLQNRGISEIKNAKLDLTEVKDFNENRPIS